MESFEAFAFDMEQLAKSEPEADPAGPDPLDAIIEDLELSRALGKDGPNLPPLSERLRSEPAPEDGERLHKRAGGLRKVTSPNGWVCEYDGNDLVRGYDSKLVDPDTFEKLTA